MPPDERLIRHASEHWPVFETWCRERGLEALPATPRTLLAFLDDPPVGGADLRLTYQAVALMHDAHFHPADMDPMFCLEMNGVRVHRDGRVEVPQRARDRYGS